MVTCNEIEIGKVFFAEMSWSYLLRAISFIDFKSDFKNAIKAYFSKEMSLSIQHRIFAHCKLQVAVAVISVGLKEKREDKTWKNN